MKKLVSLFLCAAILLCIVPVIAPEGADAAQTDGCWKLTNTVAHPNDKSTCEVDGSSFSATYNDSSRISRSTVKYDGVPQTAEPGAAVGLSLTMTVERVAPKTDYYHSDSVWAGFDRSHLEFDDLRFNYTYFSWFSMSEVPPQEDRGYPAAEHLLVFEDGRTGFAAFDAEAHADIRKYNYDLKYFMYEEDAAVWTDCFVDGTGECTGNFPEHVEGQDEISLYIGCSKATLEFVYTWTNNASTLSVYGCVTDVSGRAMPWVHVEAGLVTKDIELQRNDFTSSAAPVTSYDLFKLCSDAVTETRTNDAGYFIVKFEVPEDAIDFAVVFQISLTCVSSDCKDVYFKLIDGADSFSSSPTVQQMTVAAWADIPEADKADLRAGKSVGIPRIFDFNLLVSDNSFSYSLPGTKEPYVLYLNEKAVSEEAAEDYGIDCSPASRMAHASGLYNAAWDALHYGAVTLGENANMQRSDMEIYLRSPLAKAYNNSSHFDPTTEQIHLTFERSFFDNPGTYTIQHEFGHAFDWLTGDGITFHSYEDAKNVSVSHGGYANDSMADSYTEGFATAYAALCRLDSKKYANPAKLFLYDVSSTANYTVFGDKGCDEEFAVASLLYWAGKKLPDADLWKAIDFDSDNFYSYYQAIRTLAAANGIKETEVDAIAMSLGLYAIPVDGNGQYDLGEPFRDSNGNGVRDGDEKYCDLGFIAEDGVMTFRIPEDAETAKLFSQATVGFAAEYDRSGLIADTTPRPSPAYPAGGYMQLTGETAGFVLVTIAPKGDDAYTELRCVQDGLVYLIDPGLYEKGKVTISIPGGKTIFTASIEDLNAASDTVNNTPIAFAEVKASDLAKDGTIPCATYGDAKSTGVAEPSGWTAAKMNSFIAAAQNAGENGEKPKNTGSWALPLIILAVLGGAVATALLCIRARRKTKQSDAAEDAAEEGKQKRDKPKKVKPEPQPQKAAEPIPEPAPIAKPAPPVKAEPIPEPAPPVKAEPAPIPKPAPPVKAEPIPEPAPPVKAEPVPEVKPQTPKPPAKHEYCTRCGAKYVGGARFCRKCGAPVPVAAAKPKVRFCVHCGAELVGGARFCVKCGKKAIE